MTKKSIPCVYCGKPADTFDHVIPKRRGGTDDPSNLVPACRSCNASKGSRTLSEWIAWQHQRFDLGLLRRRRGWWQWSNVGGKKFALTWRWRENGKKHARYVATVERKGQFPNLGK